MESDHLKITKSIVDVRSKLSPKSAIVTYSTTTRTKGTIWEAENKSDNTRKSKQFNKYRIKSWAISWIIHSYTQ